MAVTSIPPSDPASANAPGRVLLVAADEEDAAEVERLLATAPRPGAELETTRVGSLEEAAALLGESATPTGTGGFLVCLVVPGPELAPAKVAGADPEARASFPDEPLRGFLGDARVRGSGVPVLLLGEGETPASDEAAREAGAADVLSGKGLSPELLARSIQYAVESRRRRRADARARALIANASEILAVLEPRTGRILFVSDAVFRVLGHDPARLAGTDLLARVHPDDVDRVRDRLEQLSTGPGRRVELRHRLAHANGSWRVLETMAENRSDDPDVAGIIVSSRDVTEKEAGERLIRMQAGLLEAVGQAVIATDLEGRVTYWNPAAERLHGWSPEEALGRSAIELVTREIDAAAAARILEAIQEEGVWSGEFQARRRDGSTVPVLASITRVRDSEGRATGVTWVFSEMTATEFALRERVKELRTLTRAGEILNDPGRALEDRLQAIVDVIPAGWSDPACTEARLVLGEIAVQTDGFRETPWMMSSDVAAAAGRRGRIDVAFTGARDEDRGTPFLAEEHDVLRSLARLVGESVARESLERVLMQAFSSLEEAIVVVDSSHAARGISYVNPAAERIFGYEAHELVGGSTERLHVDRESFLRFGEESRAAIERQGAFRGSYTLRRRDGSTFEAEQTVTPLDPHRSHASGAVSVIRDVSERRILEHRMLQMQKMESVGQLAGGIAHDFNNVLTVIRSQLDLALMELPAGPTARELELARRASDRAAALTAQLLAFSREQVLMPRTLQLDALIATSIELLGRAIGEQVQVVHDPGRDLPPVRVDPHRMEQVLLNLAVNARDAMPEGGTLTFSTFEEVVDEAEASAFPGLSPGRWVVLAVTDTGVGMAEEVARRVFEPFFTTKGRGKGTGLGLAMVYGTLRQSGGHIHVETEPGRGSRFLLRLPPADPVEEGAEAGVAPEYGPGSAKGGTDLSAPLDPGPARAPAARGAALLVIDDDDAVRHVVVRILERSGFQVIDAADGETGLALLEQGAGVDAVLTDLVLPGIGGQALLERLAEERPELPLIAMSGYVDGSPGRRDGLPPEVAFIQKPFTAQGLVALVEEVLLRH